MNRVYEAAGAEGSVSLWSAPNALVMDTVENGTTLNVQFRWKGALGPEWAYAINWDTNVQGWTPLDDLALIYDDQSFEEDHESEFISWNGTIDFHEAVLYSYPLGAAGSVLKEEPDYMTFQDVFQNSKVWKDDAGRCWAPVYYYMGHVDAWICLDDPMNENLDTNIMPVSPSPAQVRGTPTVQPGLIHHPLVVAGGLVVVVAVVTLVLLHRVKRKRHS